MVSAFGAAVQSGLRAAMAVANVGSVVYVAGSLSIVLTSAVRGTTNWRRDAVSPSSRIGDRSVDWIVAAAELVDGSGVRFEPARGHYLQVTDANGERVYQVMPFDAQSPLWVPIDREGREFLRIHTRERL